MIGRTPRISKEGRKHLTKEELEKLNQERRVRFAKTKSGSELDSKFVVQTKPAIKKSETVFLKHHRELGDKKRR